jgi:hypothetical protein
MSEMAWRRFIVGREIPQTDHFERTSRREAFARLTEGLRDLGSETQLLESYEADQRTIGVYLAKDEYVLRRQAELSGIPATNITEIDADAMLGTLSVVRGSRHDESSPEPRLFFSAAKETIEIDKSSPIAPTELMRLENDRLLLVHGSSVGDLLSIGDVQVVASLTAHIRPAVGPQRWIVLLCRFADSTGDPPETREWFENLTSASHPGLRHFFNDVSYGALDPTFDIVGWRTLPGNRADYPRDEQDLLLGSTDLFPGVDFIAYYGVIMVIDGDLKDAAGLGAGRKATIHGHRQFWGLVWLGNTGWHRPRTWAQEMGHTYGLKHTLTRFDPDDRSGWDFMGTVSKCTDTFQGGCLPQHTTGYHKDRLTWLDPARTARITSNTGSLRLASLSNSEGEGFLYVEVGIPNETERFYAVEARHRSGYDSNIPGDAPDSAIVIHEIDLNLNPESFTVDHGANATNGPGGSWLVGESFVGDGLQIDVLQELGTGFEIRVTFAPDPPIVRLEFAGCSFGSARFVPSVAPQPDDSVTSLEIEKRYVGSSHWTPVTLPTVITANSNQTVYLRARACNQFGCSAYAVVTAKQKCSVHPQ